MTQTSAGHSDDGFFVIEEISFFPAELTTFVGVEGCDLSCDFDDEVEELDGGFLDCDFVKKSPIFSGD